MAHRVLEFDEELPPIELRAVRIDMEDIARAQTADAFPFPCRCAGLALGAEVEFLDAGSAPRDDWTLIGCERSRQIHEALYGFNLPELRTMCPPASTSTAGEGPLSKIAACASVGSKSGRPTAWSCRASCSTNPRSAVRAHGAHARESSLSAHVMDSEIYGHLWGTDLTRVMFADSGCLASWLGDPRRAGRGAQAECGVILAQPPQRSPPHCAD